MQTTMIHAEPRNRPRARAVAMMAIAIAAARASATITTLPPSADDSSPFLMDRVVAFGVTGAQMANRLSVTTTLESIAGGTFTEVRPWLSDVVPDGGIASGTHWTLDQSGDTFSNPWTLTVDPDYLLKSLSFSFDTSATGEGVVFDRTVGGAEGTPGTAGGRDFVVTFSTSPGPLDLWTAAPMYARPGDVPTDSVTGFYGDIYAQLDVVFRGQPFFAALPYHVQFMQDCDITTPVPAPGALAAFGISGFAGVRRRRTGSARGPGVAGPIQSERA